VKQKSLVKHAKKNSWIALHSETGEQKIQCSKAKHFYM